jgi:threonine dehydratase
MDSVVDAEIPEITFGDIEAAAGRISGHVRRTPCLRSRFTREPLHPSGLMLKLECLQVTGSAIYAESR